MRIKNVLFILFMASFFLSHAQQDDWNVLKVDDALFNITAPCDMIHKEKEIKTAVGEVSIHSYHCTSSALDPNELYLISYTDYEPGSMDQDSIELLELFYAESLDQISIDLEGIVYYSTAHTVNGLSGILARIGYNQETAICKVFLTLVGDRFYAIQVFSKVEKSLNDESDRFFNSFRAFLP